MESEHTYSHRGFNWGTTALIEMGYWYQMTKGNIHGQIPRVEGKSFSPLGSGKAVCCEGGHKGFPVPPADPQPSPPALPSSSLPTLHLESLQEQWKCDQPCWAQSCHASPSCLLRSDKSTAPKSHQQDHPPEPTPLPRLWHLIRILHGTFQSLHPSASLHPWDADRQPESTNCSLPCEGHSSLCFLLWLNQQPL